MNNSKDIVESSVLDNRALQSRILELESTIRDIEYKDTDVIDLEQIWQKVWGDKWLIIAIGTIFVISSVFYALSISNEYKSEVLLAPATEAGGKGGALSKLAGKFGGLASLAGINMGDNGDKITLALEKLKSREFIIKFIKRNQLFVTLIAAEEWNSDTNQLIIDNEIYDFENNQWIRDISPPKQVIPTGLEAFEVFLEHLSVSKNDETGYITIAIEFYSPHIAKEWLELIVEQINNTIREEDIAEATDTIAYLKEQIQLTNIAEMKGVFYELIEGQTQTLMLANIRDEYVFKTIDPPFLPEEKSKPKRAFIVILAAFLGGIIGVSISLLRRRAE